MFLLKDIFANEKDFINKEVEVAGWIKNSRFNNNIGFIELNDGTTFKSVQIVVESKLDNFQNISKLLLPSAIIVRGKVVESTGAKQSFEINASEIVVEGESNEKYPLQKKRHTFEFLRTIQHLRPRTNTFNAVYRVRSVLSYAIHKFFYERGFVYAHTPIITSSDAEGAGEMFRVTTLDINNIPRTESGEIDFTEDFFSKPTNLTVSGQLQGEAFAMAYRNIYTFGPTFRAENSNTTRHAAEFWMIEPEIAFADLNDVIKLSEDMVKYIIKFVLENAPDEMKFFNDFIDKELLERLNAVVNSEFKVMTYTEAVEILEQKMKDSNMNIEDYSWYLDLRRFDGTKHGGYGLGFERMLMYLTGMQNIRDVLPFPRTVGLCEF